MMKSIYNGFSGYQDGSDSEKQKCALHNEQSQKMFQSIQDGNFTLIKVQEHQTDSEQYQFQRVINHLSRYSNAHLPYCIAVAHIPFHLSECFNRKRESVNGEIDLVVFTQDRIFSYELKSGLFSIKLGSTTDSDWQIQNPTGLVYKQSSWFRQVSRQRTFLLQEFLNSEKRRLNLDCHFKVDNRVVIRSESDKSGFNYSLPKDLAHDDLEKICTVLNPNKARKLRSLFSKEGEKPGKWETQKYLSDNEKKFLISVFREAEFVTNTKRWFKIVKEKELIEDFNNTSYDCFSLPFEAAHQIAIDLSQTA